MRVLFVVCLMASVLAVTTQMASDAEIVQVDVLLASAEATAIPTEVIVKMTPRPTPTPAPTAKPADVLIFAPKHPVAKVPVETAAPTAKPAPTPTPTAKPKASEKPTPAAKATASPKATSKPTTEPAPTPSGTTYTRDQVIAGIRAGWAGNDDKAVRVADCESSLNPRATSPGGTYLGLWQFHIETWRNYGGSGDPRNHSPKTQTQVAWNIYLDHGWDAWPGCA